MRKRKFTLIEVIVAIAVFGLGMTAALQMSAGATMRARKAVDRWKSQHMLAQASEYYLLAGPKAHPDSKFFPYQGASTSCSVSEPEGLPPDVDSQFGQWKLAVLEIKISYDNNRKTESIKIEKILQDGDL
ncbi:MAG TPA: hypothetical protein DCZ94_10910 [Lentisphaeria bacterium]|nr:hypothetical protein [Lentisphaeria bacterium]